MPQVVRFSGHHTSLCHQHRTAWTRCNAKRKAWRSPPGHRSVHAAETDQQVKVRHVTFVAVGEHVVDGVLQQQQQQTFYHFIGRRPPGSATCTRYQIQAASTNEWLRHFRRNGEISWYLSSDKTRGCNESGPGYLFTFKLFNLSSITSSLKVAFSRGFVGRLDGSALNSPSGSWVYAPDRCKIITKNICFILISIDYWYQSVAAYCFNVTISGLWLRFAINIFPKFLGIRLALFATSHCSFRSIRRVCLQTLLRNFLYSLWIWGFRKRSTSGSLKPYHIVSTHAN